jgi:hypothetical protein
MKDLAIKICDLSCKIDEDVKKRGEPNLEDYAVLQKLARRLADAVLVSA